MDVIPVTAVPSQTLAITLDRQPAQIALRQNGDNMYLDLKVDDTYVVRARICRDRQLLLVDVRYRGFRGELMFIDQQGVQQPNYTGLGDRFQLVYLSESDL